MIFWGSQALSLQLPAADGSNKHALINPPGENTLNEMLRHRLEGVRRLTKLSRSRDGLEARRLRNSGA